MLSAMDGARFVRGCLIALATGAIVHRVVGGDAILYTSAARAWLEGTDPWPGTVIAWFVAQSALFA
jgi:hypothetical protein